MSTIPDSGMRVKAVVGGFREGMATIYCRAPYGKVEMDIPIEWLSKQCCRYGAPIWVSVDRHRAESKVRIYERREVDPMEPPADAEEIAEWLAGEKGDGK